VFYQHSIHQVQESIAKIEKVAD